MLKKLGVFFLDQACLDYPVAVGRVVSFHGCEPPFVGGFFQRAGLEWQPQQDSHRTK